MKQVKFMAERICKTDALVFIEGEMLVVSPRASVLVVTMITLIPMI